MSSIIVLKFYWIRSQQNLGTWCSDTVILVLGSFKVLCIVITQNNQGTWFSDTVIVYSGSLKRPRITKIQKHMGPWCSDTIIIFLRISNDWASLSTEIFDINMSFEYSLDADLYQIMSEGLSYIENIVPECVCEVNYF